MEVQSVKTKWSFALNVRLRYLYETLKEEVFFLVWKKQRNHVVSLFETLQRFIISLGVKAKVLISLTSYYGGQPLRWSFNDPHFLVFTFCLIPSLWA